MYILFIFCWHFFQIKISNRASRYPNSSHQYQMQIVSRKIFSIQRNMQAIYRVWNDDHFRFFFDLSRIQRLNKLFINSVTSSHKKTISIVRMCFCIEFHAKNLRSRYRCDDTSIHLPWFILRMVIKYICQT